MAQKLESGIEHEMMNVDFRSGIAVVHADDLIFIYEESFAEMGAKKASSTGDEDLFC